MTESDPDPFADVEPPIAPAVLPTEVRAQRELADGDYQRLDSEWQPRIDAHLYALQRAVDSEIIAHRAIADRTDIALAVDTRWSAIWELSGRSLSICQVVLHDLRGGFTSQATGNVRSMYEAAELLTALSFHREDTDLRRWLAGEWVRPKAAREVMQRKQAAAHERMVEVGEVPEGDIMKSGLAIYDDLSQAAHHRRGGFPDALSVDLRQFSYGPHPNAEVRARNVLVVGHLLEMALMSVIDALADVLHDRAYFHENWATLSSSMGEVRRSHPLP